MLAKRLTVPQLSPTHTSVRLVRWLVPEGATVECYDPVLILECSVDLVSEGMRDSEETQLMIVETQEEGVVQNLRSIDDEWLPVGTKLGEIDDGEEGDWTWQAYHWKEDG